MLIGKRFRLEHATLALDLVEGKPRAITLPTGTILTIARSPHGGRPNAMVDVLWDGREVTMFAVDVDVRGTEVDDHFEVRGVVPDDLQPRRSPQKAGALARSHRVA